MSEIISLSPDSGPISSSEFISLSPRRKFNWKAFLFLMLLIIPSSYLVLPYALKLQGTVVPAGDWPAVAVVTLINALIYSAAGGLGMLLATRIGLGLPYLEKWLNKEPIKVPFRRTARLAIVVGVAAALVILALSMAVFNPLMEAELESLGINLPEEIQPAPWQGFLASFYGGAVEEVLLRLLLMSFVAWLGSLISRDREGRPSPTVMWIAVFLAAIIFGLWHLPSTAEIGFPMSPLIVTRAIVLNGLGGLAFGWLYWKRGLESAMLAHFSADIVVHFIAPLVKRLLA